MAGYIEATSNIRRLLGSGSLSDPERSKLFAVALARAIAMRLPLPTAPVNSVNVHYTQNFDQEVIKLIAGFNEHLVLDVKMVMEQTFNFYRLRYDMVHDASRFSPLLPVIAAALPEYFPERICDVMTRELAQYRANNDYFNSWSQIVGCITDCLTEVQSKEFAKPVDLSVISG
jgi:hypothetical protein